MEVLINNNFLLNFLGDEDQIICYLKYINKLLHSSYFSYNT